MNSEEKNQEIENFNAGIDFVGKFISRVNPQGDVESEELNTCESSFKDPETNGKPYICRHCLVVGFLGAQFKEATLKEAESSMNKYGIR